MLTLEQIKYCAKNNIIVHWKNDGYIVEYWKENNNFVVTCLQNNHSVGLCYKNNNNKSTHNLNDFYICSFDCDYFTKSIEP